MKCLVFSDSHGNSYYMAKALSMHRDAEVVFFLGDGIADAYELSAGNPSAAWLTVRGNCDHACAVGAAENFGRITLFDKKIYYTHGDRFGVKYGMSEAEDFAKSNSVDVFLFGHTHAPYDAYKEGIYYFNPGSIGESRDGNFSYGIMMISEKGILFSHGTLSRY